MTEQELIRFQEGVEIKRKITLCKDMLSLLERYCKSIEDGDNTIIRITGDVYIDADLIVVAITKQMERYRQDIVGLQKEFDEL